MLSDKSDDFTFHRFNQSNKINLKAKSGLYIHIPFCKNSCPYCPYWIFRSYCATYSGHIVPHKTDVISWPNLHINL